MKLDQLLQEFYEKNGIPSNGGIDQDYFDFKVFGITLTLPNPQFRKDLIHIHDIQHVLHQQDITWKGEAYIAGWEVSTGMWKHFPATFLSLWAMGYALWIHPKEVYQGYKRGYNQYGIIDLNLSKQTFLDMEFDELKTRVQKNNNTFKGFFAWMQFLIWCFISEVVLLSPILIILIIVIILL